MNKFSGWYYSVTSGNSTFIVMTTLDGGQILWFSGPVLWIKEGKDG